MKLKKVFLFIIVSLAATAFISCGGKAKSVERIIQEYKAASKSDAARFLRLQHSHERAERLYNNLISNPCVSCNGYGVVYLVDNNGFPITDYAGNYQFMFCPTCGGTGEK